MSEWADEKRMLSSKASAEPGRWRTSRTPYLREIMDCLSSHSPILRVVVMAGAQVGKTESGNNWIGYVIEHAPAPMLMVQPTLDMAKKVSKQRLAPMIESTPSLRDLVKEPREKDSGNTIMVKEFEGGILMLAGSNSAAALRSMPVRDLFMDEVDAYPGDVDGEGDPVSLAEKRTATFSRRKTFLTSTPTTKGISRIEKEYAQSDQRRYFIPCPTCGHMDFLTWRGWIGYSVPDGGEEERQHHRIEWTERDASTAVMVCGKCGARTDERNKTAMLMAGEWRATAKGNGTAGFHLSSLYSPLGWKSWAECVQEFLDSKDDPFKLKNWVNAVLGECYEEEGESIDAERVIMRAQQYVAEVPNGVGVLTASVDVQGNRLEVAVKGWGDAEESWLIAYTILMGDPGLDQVWRDLTEFLNTKFVCESGRTVGIEGTCIDSGGAHTEYVYKYCRAYLNRRVYPVKGSAVPGLPVVSRPSFSNRLRVPLFIVGTDTAKDIIYSRLRQRNPGPGYMHLPHWVDAEYVAQLCAERAITKYVKGKGARREYVKLRERNEALDLEVYALVALHLRGPQFVASLRRRAEDLASRETQAAPAPRMTQTASSWVQSWRR